MSTDNHVNESILNSDIKEWQKKNRIDHMACRGWKSWNQRCRHR